MHLYSFPTSETFGQAITDERRIFILSSRQAILDLIVAQMLMPLSGQTMFSYPNDSARKNPREILEYCSFFSGILHHAMPNLHCEAADNAFDALCC